MGSGDTGFPESVIEDIRTSEFLLNVENESAKVRRGAKSLQTKLNRALKQLSEDLYSKQTHFVLELIQNADDNDYAKGTVAELSFSVRPRELVLSNNEVGFQEKHVRALCDVANSSKTKKEGYIGEKGIGFKAVFTVSDAPEIHSNGYHFKFDRSDPDNLLGYVVPTWCGPRQSAPNAQTTIVLPAKAGFAFGSETFADIDARILLFLSKLAQLRLAFEDSEVSFRQEARDGGLLRLHTEKVTKDGLVAEHVDYLRASTAIKMDDLEEVKRPQFKASTVVLAFPVSEKVSALPQKSSQVHAFLPIRRFGFRFSIQADFILSSSREEIHTELAWNQRLRNAIGLAFVLAVPEFKKTGSLGLTYLKYVPAASEVHDEFFESVRDDIVDRLRATECLPSVEGAWKQPSQLRRSSLAFRKLFPPGTAQRIFGFDYLDPRVEAPDGLLDELGVEHTTYAEYVHLFGNHSEWVLAQPTAWKVKLYAAMANDVPALVDAGIASTACVPLEGGTMASPDDGAIFYPLGRGRKFGFEGEIKTLDAAFWEALEESGSAVTELLGALNVNPDKPHKIIAEHILPRHEGDEFPDSTNEALIGHVKYVKEKLTHYLAGEIEAGISEDDALAKLGDSLWVATKAEPDESWTFDRSPALYLSSAYQPEFCIETLLQGSVADELLVSPAYLASKAKDAEADRAAWRVFFSRIGIRRSPAVKKSLYSQDWECSGELLSLLGNANPSTRRAALESIDRNWYRYSDKLTYNSRSGRGYATTATTFAGALRRTQAPTRRRSTAPLEQCFYPSEEIKELLGDRVVYVDAVIEHKGFLDAAGVTHSLDYQACLKRLRQMKTEGGESSSQVQRLYRKLESFWHRDSQAIKDAFTRDSLIRAKTESGIVWANPNEVTWRANSPFLDSIYPPLQGQYRDFSSFFGDKLGVRDLSVEKRVQALIRLTEISDIQQRREEALAIYKRANADLSRFGREDPTPPSWLPVFKVHAVFVDQHGSLVKAGSTLFANDEPSLAEHFLSHGQISLLGVAPEEVPRLSRLLKAVHVRLLSTAVVVSVVEASNPRVNRVLTDRVHRVVPYLARVMYVRENESFEAALKSGVYSRLAAADVLEVDNLKQRLELIGAVTVVDAALAGELGQIFIRENTRSLMNRLAMEVCRQAGASDGLADVVSLLLRETSDDECEELLRLRRVSSLPPDVQALLAPSLLDGEKQSDDEAVDDPDVEPEVESELSAEKEPALAVDSPPMTNTEHASARDQSVAAATAKRSARFTPPSSTPPSEPLPTLPVRARVEENASPHQPGLVDLLRDLAPGQPAIQVVDQQDPASSPDTQSNIGSPPPNLQTLTARPSQHRRNSEKRRDEHTPRERLLSYADAPTKDSPLQRQQDEADVSDLRSSVEQAAVDFFIEHFGSRWTSLQVMPPNNPGFDIRAMSSDGEEVLIEVKGQSGPWTREGVAVTRRELKTAAAAGSSYWLAVVEYALDPNRRAAYLIQDPFTRTSQFRFDSGWRAVATRGAPARLVPATGLRVSLPGVGDGVIVSAKAKGRFYKLHVQLNAGGQVHRVFNPDTMSLSSD